MIIHLKLTTWPPSLNDLFTPYKGRMIKSRAYRAWVKVAQIELMTQPPRLPEMCYYRADILIPGACGFDLDNVGSKAIFDALGSMKKTPDDRYLVDYRVRWHSGDHVAIALKTEGIEPWATIRNASKSLIRRMSRD